jgi:NAD(P)-dependent dehydrogenase (short-subunit alcohol dehydrogenase family)
MILPDHFRTPSGGGFLRKNFRRVTTRHHGRGAMKEFKDKVAVITGAASGIGRALAERCVHEGMKVVLADVDLEALTSTEAALKATGTPVVAVVTDVSKAQDIAALAERTLAAFGAVHLLCNNAGVWGGISAWDSSLADWEWVLGVNLWGVIHGIHTFVPIMLAQETDGHIVNTASLAGLLTGRGPAAYRVSKHAVVALSEMLYHQLAQRTAKVKVSVLCPGGVDTQIIDAARNRPAHLPVARPLRPDEVAVRDATQQGVRTGMAPAHVAEQVFQAITAEQFYILTHPSGKAWVRTRMEDILQERNPTPQGA